jgi:hypothetical protein
LHCRIQGISPKWHQEVSPLQTQWWNNNITSSPYFNFMQYSHQESHTRVYGEQSLLKNPSWKWSCSLDWLSLLIAASLLRSIS